MDLMVADPIYLETESEMPDLIDRLRRAPGADVPVVLPARSRIGQSRFNFQLLQHYAGRLGKRVAVISPDESARRMADEAGLKGYAALGEYDAEGELGPPLMPQVGSAAAGLAPALNPPAAVLDLPRAEGPPPGAGLAAAPQPQTKPAVAARAAATPIRAAASPRAPARAARPARAQSEPPRRLMYAGAGLVMLAGLVAIALYVPSAQVTLVAQAQPFSQSFDLTAAPGQGPIATRAISVTDQASQTIQTTGVLNIPAKTATGTVTFASTCPQQIYIPQHFQVMGNGQTFQITTPNAGTLPNGEAGTPITTNGNPTPFAIQAMVPGAAGNVLQGAVNTLSEQPAGQPQGCLTVTNAQATTGGADLVNKKIMSQADFDTAQKNMQQQLQQQITGGLQKQLKSGESLATQNIFFEPPQFTTDHKVGDAVQSFTASMSLKGDGTAYTDSSVRNALLADLKSKVKPGYQLTDNSVQTNFSVTGATGDGGATFHGTSSGYIAPVLDFSAIKSHLARHSDSSARSYLATLPVRSATVSQGPFPLPLLPWLSSRIEVRYVVEQAPPATASA